MPRRRQPPPDPLGEYRAKRSADRTGEPFGRERDDRPGLFVVHKHAATRLHYDLRLEMGGVLQSWAIPKGPSLDPQVKRLAMLVEEHPLEYADFEGVIPEGNYGAGPSIVWDRGLWVPVKDPKHGVEKGKLLFELRGHKLRGLWTLFRTSRGPKDWMIVKKPDGHSARDGAPAPAEESIFSGLTVEELGDGHEPAKDARRLLRRWKTPRGAVEPESVALMLAQPRAEPFTRRGWVFELKYDGFRLIAARRGGRPYLRYRRGGDATASFPEIATALAALPYDGLVLDGEIVVPDEDGKPSFHRLQGRFRLRRPADIARASVHLPAMLYAFDLLACEGFDLRSLSLTRRKQLLQRVLPPVGPVRYSEHIDERGEEMFAGVERLGLEGIVAKRGAAPYRGERSDDWLKIRADRTGDFVIVGYTAPKRGRSGFGALHLAALAGEELVYAGRVGTGFDDALLGDLHARLQEARRPAPACSGPTPSGKEHTWVRPELVCEVRYKQWTPAGNLRHPVFLRLRDDKPVAECVREGAPPRAEPETADVSPAPPERLVPFTNLDKVFWPKERYTKGDLIEFYGRISPWLLPYLRDRPVVLTRFPDGIEGKQFFQKDAPDFVPDWIRTETMWSEHAGRKIHYFIADDQETLLYLANLGTIPLHIWSSRVSTLQSPDWCILDLDPKGAPFGHVVRVAKAIRSLCEDIELPSFVKTSGSTGLHVLLPLGRQCTYEQSRTLGHLLATIVAAGLPDIATTARSMAARKGRVYIDFLQNGHGRLLVSPFSVRPLPGAPVSTPLRWTEVSARLDNARHTIRTVPARLRRMRTDPLLPVLDAVPDLGAVLQRLEERLRES